jgi:hypothetical protein
MICWQEPGPWRTLCAHCGKDHRNDLPIHYGRCRSGRRWFWAAWVISYELGYPDEHGWSDSEAQAFEDARAAVTRLAGGRTASASVTHGTDSYKLKQINAEKRRAKPPSNAKDTPVVEYLYGWSERYPIVKRTKQRVYYLKKGEPIDARGEPIDYGNIRDFSREGEVGFKTYKYLEANTHGDYRLYFTSLEALLAAHRRREENLRALYAQYGRAEPEKPDLAALKAAMTAAHPDKGGSSAAFIEARQRYVAARRAYRTHAN